MDFAVLREVSSKHQIIDIFEPAFFRHTSAILSHYLITK